MNMNSVFLKMCDDEEKADQFYHKLLLRRYLKIMNRSRQLGRVLVRLRR